MKATLSKQEIIERNNKIIEMSKKGVKQTEIAPKFGVSAQRIGQIINAHKNGKKLRKNVEVIVDEISKLSKEKLFTSVIDSNIDSDVKLKLAEILLSK